MNQHAAPTEMAHVTGAMKDRLSSELQPILQAWYLSNSYYDMDYDEADYTRRILKDPEDDYTRMREYVYRNTGDLVLTSIYGIRRYHNGSILRMHADTADTHVISAIINVYQEGLLEVGQDWQLLILDHNHQEHNISMKPGMIFMICIIYINVSICILFMYVYY